MDDLPNLSPSPGTPQEQPPPKRRGLTQVLLAVLVPAVVGGLVAFGVLHFRDDGGTTRTVTVTESIDASGQTVTQPPSEAEEDADAGSGGATPSIPAVVRQAA